MAQARPPAQLYDASTPNALTLDVDKGEQCELREENRQLRDLVIHLSKIILKNAAQEH